MTASDRLERLLAVQSEDMHLASLESRREEIGPRRGEMTREITALESERVELGQAREQARLLRRAKESELDFQREKLTRYERQLNEVKTNVAYSALLSEIQRAKREISGLEDEILELMTQSEDHDRRIGEIDSELEAKRETAAGALEELAAEERQLEREIATARGRREALVVDVDRTLYRMYDRLRRARRFPALVPLRGHACGACHGSLPPQIVREITHEGALHVCESCGVLVYAAPEGRPAPAGFDRI